MQPSTPLPTVRRGAMTMRAVLVGVVLLLLGGCGLGEGQAETGRAPVTSASTPTRSAAEETRAAKPAEDQEDRDHGAEDAERGATATPSKAPEPLPLHRPRRYLVTRVVDGDTVELANGETVRLVGIDTPEQGECGYDQATALMERLVLGRRVRLTRSDEDRDRYDRLLRYVDVGKVDAGLRQIEAGLAVARYDSRDGYGYHPRENRYIAADLATPDKKCRAAVPPPAGAGAASGCEPGYTPCVPAYPPDVDCADVAGPVRVTGSDPHGLDRDGDGVACES